MRALWPLALPLLLAAGEYDEFAFEAASYEKQRFEYQGYLRSDNSYFVPQTDTALWRSSNEFNAQGDLYEGALNLHADYSLFYRHSEYGAAQSSATLNALYQQLGDERNSLRLGKEVLRWGKGYAYNPVAFFQRAKDPVYPELSREGYTMAHAQFTRTPQGFMVDNYTLSLLFAPDIEDNRPLLGEEGAQAGAKLYMLLGRTDIDIVVARNAYGADISSDVGYGLELHGEYAWQRGRSSWLAGARYQSATELTLIAEYTHTFEKLHYAYVKATQKEPFEIVYSTLYALYIDETQSAQYRLLAGATYDMKNGFAFDGAYFRTDRGEGGKLIVQYYF